MTEIAPTNFAIFSGEYDLTIDSKNRLLCPSNVREMVLPELSNEGGDPVVLTDSEIPQIVFMATVGYNRKPWLYTKKFYRHLVSQRPPEWIPKEEALAFRQLYFGGASELPLDRQGRLLLPAKLMQRTGLGKAATLVGVGEHLELWNTDDWEARFDQLLSTSADVARRAKEFEQ